jgi:hypothetical protein
MKAQGIDAEVVVGTDVDGTLVRRNDEGEISILNPYDNVTYRYSIHTEHVELLRQYKGRGFFNIVWSANGKKHAESVIDALGLNDGTIDLVMTKCMKHLDDKTKAEFIVGSRVFIPKAGWVG